MTLKPDRPLSPEDEQLGKEAAAEHAALRASLIKTLTAAGCDESLATAIVAVTGRV